MTPRKAIRISTPTPEELQALYDLSSETSEAEGPQNAETIHQGESECEGPQNAEIIHQGELVRYYNDAVLGLDALFEAAISGSGIAAQCLRTLARTAVNMGGHFG